MHIYTFLFYTLDILWNCVRYNFFKACIFSPLVLNTDKMQTSFCILSYFFVHILISKEDLCSLLSIGNKLVSHKILQILTGDCLAVFLYSEISFYLYIRYFSVQLIEVYCIASLGEMQWCIVTVEISFSAAFC